MDKQIINNNEILLKKLVDIASKLLANPQFLGSLTGPLVGFSVAVVGSGIIYFFWRHKSGRALQKELDLLQSDNVQLKTKCRSLLRESRDLRKTNSALIDESKDMSTRIHNLETRTLDLLEAVTSKDNTLQIQLLKEIYKEQILALRAENVVLTKKNESLRDSLECAICFCHEANNLLRPCGHSVCSDCYTEIEKQWMDSSKYYQDFGPQCPFCRREVCEVLPKFHN